MQQTNYEIYTHIYTDTRAQQDTLVHTVSLNIRILSVWSYFMQCFASCSAVMSRLRNGAVEKVCGLGKVNTTDELAELEV